MVNSTHGVSGERGLYATQTAILELVAPRGEELAPVFASLCLLIERQSPGALCAILAIDREEGVLRTAAAPNLEPAYADALDRMVSGEGAGSCGTAVVRGEPVIVVDTDIDPLWDAFRELAQRHSVRACGSTLIWSPEH